MVIHGHLPCEVWHLSFYFWSSPAADTFFVWILSLNFLVFRCFLMGKLTMRLASPKVFHWLTENVFQLLLGSQDWFYKSKLTCLTSPILVFLKFWFVSGLFKIKIFIIILSGVHLYQNTNKLSSFTFSWGDYLLLPVISPVVPPAYNKQPWLSQLFHISEKRAKLGE